MVELSYSLDLINISLPSSMTWFNTISSLCFDSTSAMSLLYECINTVIAVLISISTGMPGHSASIQVFHHHFFFFIMSLTRVFLFSILFSSAFRNCAFWSKIRTRIWNIWVCWPCPRYWKLIPNRSRLTRISSYCVWMIKMNRFDCGRSTYSTAWYSLKKNR